MRKELFILSLTLAEVGVWAGAGCAHAEATPPVELPSLVIQDFGGKSVSLSQYRGNVILLDFWASWCPSCETTLPRYERLYEAHRDHGLVVLAVNLDEDEQAAKDFLKKKSLKIITLRDSNHELAEKMVVSAMPTLLLIDRAGKVRAREDGFKRSNWSKVEKTVKDLLDEKAPTGERRSQNDGHPHSSNTRPGGLSPVS